MRRPWLTVIAALLLAAPAAAQQGSVQVIAATQVTTGDPSRTGGLGGYQPDFGFSWFKPTVSWGKVTFDAHAVRAGNDPRLGRALFAVKDLKKAGFTWKLSVGDTAFTPFLTDYGFNNLFAPQVTFRGASVSANKENTDFSVTAGRVTVFRDLFGANADALGQSLFVARASHKLSSRVEVVAHGSRVRTEDLQGFNYLIESSDDAGAGVRVNVTKTVQIIADAGVTSFLRKNAATWDRKPSFLVGTRWTAKRGWFQVDAHRFSPGNFSVLNNPYTDREGLFAAGEYEFNRVRVFGGWDAFRNDRQAQSSAPGSWYDGTSSRAYGGGRVKVNSHLWLGTRIENGARVSMPSQYTVGYESNTGSKSADFQFTVAKWNVNGRYERRSDVQTTGGQSTALSTYTQHDLSGQAMYNVANGAFFFANFFTTEYRDRAGGGQSFRQVSAGGNFQLAGNRMTARGEVIISRNRELQRDFLTPRSALSGGLNARLTPRIGLSLDVFLDRTPATTVTRNPWMTRTIVRLVYSAPTGSPVNTRVGLDGAPMARGRETIQGMVFVDWNANGVQDPGEEALGGVGVLIDNARRTSADEKGRFRFDRLASGPHRVRLDVGSVPAEFDTPSSEQGDVTLQGRKPVAVAFGLLPVGDIRGVVVRDTNGNGEVDDSDKGIDGAVLVLDDGARTEVAHNGRFTFSGVRLGTHTVQLLLETLPDDASLGGERVVQVEVNRERRTAAVTFLARAEKRPEIRKVFPRRPEPEKPDAPGSGRVEKAPARNGAPPAGPSRSGPSRGGHSRSGQSGSSQPQGSESKTSESKTSAAGTAYGADKTNLSSNR